MGGNKLLAEWFWIERWDGSPAAGLPLLARGLYREMLTRAWRLGGWLPTDHAAIQRLVRVTPAEWRRAWPLVAPYWRHEGTRLINDTQLEVMEDARRRREVASEHGRRAAASRRLAQPEHISGTARAHLGHSPSTSRAQPEMKPPSPSPSPTNEPTERVEEEAASDGERTKLGLSADQRTEYAQAVWAALVERRGSERPEMSSAEWDQLARWMDAAVPLRIVLAGIRECGGKPKHLLYCLPAVREALERFRKAVPL